MARTTAQDAMRLLFLLVYGAKLVSDNPDGYVAVFEGKTRLHALDFWVRYPDFLAHELLNLYDETANDAYLQAAKQIFEDQEPDIRTIPMSRYRFGAFESLTEVLSILISKGLVYQQGTKVDGKIMEYQFMITQLAKDLVSKISQDFPVLLWYDQRVHLVLQVAGDLGGTALKEKQYQHLQYAQTQLGTVISSIKTEVMARLGKY